MTRHKRLLGPPVKIIPFGLNVFDFLNINGIRKNFAIHIALTNSSCNQLIVLTAEIKNNDSFFCSISS